MTKPTGSSFYWAMRLMSRPRRNAMYAIYAFCREVDDIADDGPFTQEQRRRQLAEWRDEIARLYAGVPRDPLAVALVGPVAEFGLEQADFLAVIDGVEMDARDEMVRPSLAQLDLYCDHVASAVGRLSVRVFGDFQPRCLQVADSLGRALQLTNILRDLDEDAARGRLYLPDELLATHGIAGKDPRAVLAHPALSLVRRDLAAIARSHFAAAHAAMAGCSRRAMRPAALMGAIYGAILDRLEAGRPVRISTPAKMWYALRHGLL